MSGTKPTASSIADMINRYGVPGEFDSTVAFQTEILRKSMSEAKPKFENPIDRIWCEDCDHYIDGGTYHTPTGTPGACQIGVKPVLEGPPKYGLNATDVCRILDACSRSHVSVLKFAGLEVEFGTPANAVPLPLDAPATAATLAETEISENKIHETNTKTSLEADERRIRADQIEYLRITQPAEYERMLLDGELGEEDGDGSDGDPEAT